MGLLEGHMTEHSRNDPRTDQATARIVDQGLQICRQQGVNFALQFLEQAGVARLVSIRVLCSPDHYRKRERRKYRRPTRKQELKAFDEKNFAEMR